MTSVTSDSGPRNVISAGSRVPVLLRVVWPKHNAEYSFRREKFETIQIENITKLDWLVDRVKPWFMVNGLAHGL